MEALAKEAKTPEFIQNIGKAGEMDKMVEKATGLLENAKAEVDKAVTELKKTADVAQISAEELDKLRAWTSFQIKYAQMAQVVNQTLPAALEAFHQSIRDLENDSVDKDDKAKKKAPDPGQPTPAPGGGSSKAPPQPAPQGSPDHAAPASNEGTPDPNQQPPGQGTSPGN